MVGKTGLLTSSGMFSLLGACDIFFIEPDRVPASTIFAAAFGVEYDSPDVKEGILVRCTPISAFSSRFLHRRR